MLRIDPVEGLLASNLMEDVEFFHFPAGMWQVVVRIASACREGDSLIDTRTYVRWTQVKRELGVA